MISRPIVMLPVSFSVFLLPSPLLPSLVLSRNTSTLILLSPPSIIQPCYFVLAFQRKRTPALTLNATSFTTGRSLERDAYEKYKDEPWLKDFEWMKSTDTDKVEKEVLKKEV